MARFGGGVGKTGYAMQVADDMAKRGPIRLLAPSELQEVAGALGTGGGWLWELPSDRDGALAASSITGQKARTERRVPADWVEGVARLQHHRQLADVPRHLRSGTPMRQRGAIRDMRSYIRTTEETYEIRPAGARCFADW